MHVQITSFEMYEALSTGYKTMSLEMYEIFGIDFQTASLIKPWAHVSYYTA